MIEMGYEQFVDNFTHNRGNLLDVVIANEGCDIIRTKPEVDFATFQGYSDHAGIILDLNIMITHESAMRTVFDYKNCDYARLTECIINNGIDYLISDRIRPDSKWTLFRNTIIESMAKLAFLMKHSGQKLLKFNLNYF